MVQGDALAINRRGPRRNLLRRQLAYLGQPALVKRQRGVLVNGGVRPCAGILEVIFAQAAQLSDDRRFEMESQVVVVEVEIVGHASFSGGGAWLVQAKASVQLLSQKVMRNIVIPEGVWQLVEFTAVHIAEQ